MDEAKMAEPEPGPKKAGARAVSKGHARRPRRGRTEAGRQLGHGSAPVVASELAEEVRDERVRGHHVEDA